MRRTSKILTILLAFAGCDATIGSNDEIAGSETDGSETDDGETDDGETGESGVPSDCIPFMLSMDGCPSDALCMDDDPDPEVEVPACFTMPPCAADHTCPVGVYGAHCNTGKLPDKDEICLIGICDVVEECPADWFCVRYAENDPLGICSSGTLGEPCTGPQHCVSGMCFTPIPGLPGFCQ